MFIFQNTSELSCIHTVQEGKGSEKKKKSFLSTKLICHQILAVITAPVAKYHRAAPYLHSCSTGIPLTHKIMERRTGM